MEMFLSSERGKRILNFCYSWGASVVIIGALFKLLHLPYANQILFVSLITESLVFFVSAFERPGKEYHWEDVFPVLGTKNPLDRPDFSNNSVSSMINSEDNAYTSQPLGQPIQMNANMEGMGSVSGGGRLNIAGNLDLSEEDTSNLSASIKKLSTAAEQLSKMAEMTEATQSYMTQLSDVAQHMERFGNVTNSLTNISDTLLTSYQTIADNKDGITESARGYVQQMEQLNRNVSGLNTIYEIQLRSVSSQIEAIEHINGGLARIKDLYDGSVVDSSVFRNETEKMAQQLAQLNQVYGRLLQAMTVNMPGAVPMPPQPQPQQAPPPPQQYAQQPPQGYAPQQTPYGYSR